MNEYIPGACNIGSAEIARRRNFGWVSLAVSIILFIVLVWTGANPFWRLFLFFPAAAAASGFLQAYFHFCSGFARLGVYNFGAPGQTTKIEDETARKKDKRKGFQITLIAALFGAVLAVLSTLPR